MHLRQLLPLFVLTAVNAQYFSKGWAPGQQQQQEQGEDTASSTAAAWTPSSTGNEGSPPPRPKSLSATVSELFDPLTWIQLGPVPALFERFGVNVTEVVAAARNHSYWDPTIPLITDNNFEQVIANEEFESDKEEKDRVWAIMITATESTQESVSKFADETFDEAFQRTVRAGDMSNVKWGRIDYLNVTYLTTKWAVWRAPTILILKDRGRSLRFYPATHLKLHDGAFRDFLLAEAWKSTPPWTSIYGPGGDREWMLHNFALVMKAIYDKLSKVPKFVLMIASGVIGSLVLGLMHRMSGGGSSTKQQTPPTSTTTKPLGNGKKVEQGADVPKKSSGGKKKKAKK